MNHLSAQSETYGTNKILEAFSRTFPNLRLLQNIILPIDQGYGVSPTAEMDTLVVCEAGVFMFEIKGYEGGEVEIKKTPQGISFWKIHRPEGTIDISDPLHQGGRKLKFLRESILYSIESCTIRGYVYFTNENIILPPTTSSDVIITSDLNYLPRCLRTEAKRRKSTLPKKVIDDIADSILASADGHTLAEHIYNCHIAKAAQKYTKPDNSKNQLSQ